jgi:hypothetical protein
MEEDPTEHTSRGDFTTPASPITRPNNLQTRIFNPSSQNRNPPLQENLPPPKISASETNIDSTQSTATTQNFTIKTKILNPSEMHQLQYYLTKNGNENPTKFPRTRTQNAPLFSQPATQTSTSTKTHNFTQSPPPHHTLR